MTSSIQPATSTSTSVRFEAGDYVLYRDPHKFWRGLPGHTFICRVSEVRSDRGKFYYQLLPVSGGVIDTARGDYMRLLPPLDAMRDIDTAALDTEDAADSLTSAAMAWLTQQAKPDAAPDPHRAGCDDAGS